MMKSAFKLVYIENLNWANSELSFNSNDDTREIAHAKLLCFFLVRKGKNFFVICAKLVNQEKTSIKFWLKFKMERNYLVFIWLWKVIR